jgi:hypothetical protein
MSVMSTPFARWFVMFVASPLLFIAGVQLFILSEHTDVYFAWTIALPLTAAFMGAGYWAALIAAYTSLWQRTSIALRVVGPASIAATGLLGIATFLHLDKFHLAAPALLTRFVTWVWIIVYVVTPFVFLVLWIRQGLDRDDSMGAHPILRWMRFGYVVQAVLVLIAGILLFLFPAGIAPLWPWALTPLTSRAVGAWLVAYGLACVAIFRENDLPNTAGTRASLLAFCLLQFAVLARYFSSFDMTKPLAWLYLLVLLIGAIVGGASLINRSANQT